MTLTPITKHELEQKMSVEPYYRGRWGYFSKAIEFVVEQKPQTALELGPSTMPLIHGGHTMDFFIEDPTIRHDARVFPWPVRSKKYDVFIALQVWEHLCGFQQEAFREVMRISHFAVLSFPLLWSNCDRDDDHYKITEQKISSWTLQYPCYRKSLVSKRLILAFNFSKSI